MDAADSLDWIWQDNLETDDLANLTETQPEEDECDRRDEYVIRRDADDDPQLSDSSSCDSSDDGGVAKSLIDDLKTARELNRIADDKLPSDDDVEDGDGDDDGDDGDGDGDEDDESAVDKFYVDASETVRKTLSEVRLAWADTLHLCTVNESNVPDSYRKTTNVEKSVLLCARNFVEQCKVKCPDDAGRQLALVLKNECGVQKCVCTTIKPSRLVYPDVMDMTSYSRFVANHITYTRLEDPTLVPKTLASPATVLEMQTAHCFELSALLVSFLVGCGYEAFVAQGYASEDVCNNDPRKIKLDLPESNDESKSVSDDSEDADDDDASRPAKPEIDLHSEFVKFLMEEEQKKIELANRVNEDDSNRVFDPLYGKRVHCWVVIVPSSRSSETDDGPFFIEPSTGERKQVSDENYVGIEAIWNHKNYWVNSQPSDGGCSQYDFTLTDTDCWQCFLPDSKLTENESSRHVVMPNSWVSVLQVPRNKYLLLYPRGKKVVSYQNALKESYSDHAMPDGLVERTTFYAPGRADETFVRELFRHRRDHMTRAEKSHGAADGIKTVEHFARDGRKDCMKTHEFWGDSNDMRTKRAITFYNLRRDGMADLKIDENGFTVTYFDRSDLLFWRCCEYDRNEDDSNQSLNVKGKPASITEKYLRDRSKHKDRDIATRRFDLSSNVVEVEYQYGEGQITQSQRRFFKPGTTTTGNEDLLDPDLVVENIVYPFEGHLGPHEARVVLRDTMKAENRAIREVSELEDEILEMLRTRCREQTEFQLRIDSLDWDRNHKMRKLLRKKKDKKLAIAERDKGKLVDCGALPPPPPPPPPYFENARAPRSRDEASKARDKIVKHFKQNTQNQFIRSKIAFLKTRAKWQSIMKELETDVIADLKLKKSMLMSCSSLKTELEVLALKMERYNGTRVHRYDNLASNLNRNPVFKILPPLKVYSILNANKIESK